ncbi:hypothetical protein BJX61DRAFT_541826 [Aspergillus egyptiacus]|nr:hypothetical protein BJX61DRAFT_541826 [Aspergillus egyptiacus]
MALQKSVDFLSHLTAYLGIGSKPEAIPGLNWLCELPPELISLIATFLDYRSNLALRSTSRRIWQSTHHHFTSTYIHTVHTDLSMASMKKVRELVECNQLAGCVKNLHIDSSSSAFLGTGLPWEREYAYNFVLNEIYPRGTLKHPQESALGWQSILRGLTNCNSFRFTIAQAQEYKSTPEDALRQEEAVNLILLIIADAQIQVRSFSICSGPEEALPMPVILDNRVSLHHQHLPALQMAWSNLHSLTLRRSLIAPQNDLLCLRFILTSTKLRKLDLCLNALDRHASTELLSSLATAGYAFQLQEFSPRSVKLETLDPLSLFLRRHGRTLRRLDLRYLRYHGADGSGGGWVDVLKTVRDHCRALDQITLCWLRHGFRNQYLSFIDILLDPTVDEAQGTRFNIEWSAPLAILRRAIYLIVSYEDPRMDLALERLVSCRE